MGSCSGLPCISPDNEISTNSTMQILSIVINSEYSRLTLDLLEAMQLELEDCNAS